MMAVLGMTRGSQQLRRVAGHALGWFGAGLCVAVLSGTAVAADGSERLHAMQRAAHQLDYTGVFVHQQGQQVYSSRIVHTTEEGSERQRIEVLDGPMAREVIRHGDEVQSYWPERRVVWVEQRESDHFPALLQGPVDRLAEFYEIEPQTRPGRVAGRACDVLRITPRDELRWGYRLCVDQESGLLLKLQTLDDQGDVLEQIAFTEVSIGNAIDPSGLQPRADAAHWPRLSAGEPVALGSEDWSIVAPAGFAPVRQLRRQLREGGEVQQIVLSDGLAAMSVFIESRPEGAEVPDPFGLGATQAFCRGLPKHTVTVLGEVPAETVRQVAEAITHEASDS